MSEGEGRFFKITKAHLYIPNVGQSTIRDWYRNGVRNKLTGRLVYLKTRQRGGSIETCVEWYNKFIEDLNKGD